MSSFVNPLLLPFAALALVPVLIHLINLVRQRRVQWAAMEFLLSSQRKNSTWIRIKELLLMLLRMAAVAGIVMMLAQPLLDRELGFRLGGQRTHHIVLLDDSFSMSDRAADTSAFQRAKLEIANIAQRALQQTTPQTFTLARFSQAQAPAGQRQPDLLAERVDASFDSRLAEKLDKIQTSQLAVGPSPILDSIGALVGEAHGENRILYLLTDFRRAQWSEPGELGKLLNRLTADGFHLQLINCVDTVHPNLAIASLRPAHVTRAAGVPLGMEIKVSNFGSDRVRDLPVVLEEDGVGRSPLMIDEIGPGQSETRSFPVLFATAGEHTITAHLPSDAVAVDNWRYEVVGVPVNVPVLIIEGDAEGTDARFLAVALAPGGNVKTGLDPRIESPAYLNNNPLDKFRVIYLTNVERLDHAAVEALEKYVRAGGGLAIFMGPRAQPDFYTKQLYRDGQGLFPLPVVGATQLLVDRLEKSPDLEITDHPVFRVFAGERNGFLSAVSVEQFFAAPRDWRPEPGSQTTVVARLRNGSPFAVEREFGAGRVLAILSTAAPSWNNWARNPSFVVATLAMQAYLDSTADAHVDGLVGEPIELTLDAARYHAQLHAVPPPGHPIGPANVDAVEGSQQLTATLTDTSVSGIYEAHLSTNDDQPEIRRYAVNVDAAEGDLAALDGEQLATRLKGIKYEYRQAGQFSAGAQELAGSNVSDVILYILVGLLIGEQVLAYSASYHPATREGGR